MTIQDGSIFLGHLYEASFNSGIIKFLCTKFPTIISPYREVLESYYQTTKDVITDFADIENEFEEIGGDRYKIRPFICKSYLEGYSFFSLYLENIYGKSVYALQNKLECPLLLFNNFDISNKKNERSYLEKKLKFELFKKSKFYNEDISIENLHRKGEFLQTDFLMLLYLNTNNQKKYNLFSIDLSNSCNQNFFPDIMKNEFEEINSFNFLLSTIAKKHKEVISRNIWSDLNVDINDATISKDIYPIERLNEHRQYFDLFKKQDKELSKFIQAGAYAYSLIDLFQSELKNDELDVFIAGISNDNISTINWKYDDKLNSFLKKMFEIYSGSGNSAIEDSDPEAFVQKKIRYLDSNYKINVSKIRKFILKGLPEEGIILNSKKPQIIEDEIEISDNNRLVNSLRVKHTQVVHNQIDRKDLRFIFLLGNPGIGKTYSLIDKIKKEKEKSLIIYTSPRVTINNDFEEQSFELIKNRSLLSITSNQKYAEFGVVRYNQNNEKKFMEMKTKINDVAKKRLKNKDEIDDYIKKEKDKGYNCLVTKNLNSRCSIISKKRSSLEDSVINSIQTNLRNCILNSDFDVYICTFATQGGLKTKTKNTIENLYKMFVDDEKDIDAFTDASFLKIKEKIKNIYIMFDEITGCEQAVSSFNILQKKFKKLNEHFNIKYLVADASINNKNVIKKYIEGKHFDYKKIYVENFERPKDNKGDAVECVDFKYKNENSVFVNVNSFPATKILSKYIIFNGFENIKTNFSLDQHEDKLKKEKIAYIKKEILHYYKQSKNRQLLIFLQDKSSLKTIKEDISKTIPKDKVLIIDSNHNKNKHLKKEIGKRNDFDDNNRLVKKIILITSSATRGLSFKYVDHLIMDIPDFALESQLMEIIQGIYRGRGNPKIEGEIEFGNQIKGEPKEIDFIISEKFYYDSNSKDLRTKEKMLKHRNNILFKVAIIKSCMTSRIFGGQLILEKNNKQYFKNLIPIDGKHEKTFTPQDKFEKLYSFFRDIEKAKTIDKIKELISQLQKNIFGVMTFRQDSKDNLFFESISEIFSIFQKNLNFKMISYKEDNSGVITNALENIFWEKDSQNSLNTSIFNGIACTRRKIKRTTNFNIKNCKYLELKQELLEYTQDEKLEEREYELHTSLVNLYKFLEEMGEENCFQDSISNKTKYIAIPLDYFLNLEKKTNQHLPIDLKNMNNGLCNLSVREFQSEEPELINLFFNLFYGIIHKGYGADRNSLFPILECVKNSKEPFVFFDSDTVKYVQEKYFLDNNIRISQDLNMYQLLF